MMDDFMRERYELVTERIREIREHCEIPAPYCGYFQKMAGFLCSAISLYELKRDGILQTLPIEILRQKNRELYGDLVGEAYTSSYADPAYCTTVLGSGKLSPLMAAMAAEFYNITVYAYEGRSEEVLVILELFSQLYTSFEGGVPEYREVSQMLYWYAWDYLPLMAGSRTAELLLPERNVFLYMDPQTPEWGENGTEQQDAGAMERSLYLTGEYVSENTVRMQRYVNRLSKEEVDRIASVYTEGYRRGFILGRKDLSKKSLVEIRVPLGFERIICRSAELFREMGLSVTMRRDPRGIHNRNYPFPTGCYGMGLNPQYRFDHASDDALFMDKKYLSRKLEVLRESYESLRKEALGMGGPAVIEFWGEKPESPVIKPEAPSYSEEQKKWKIRYEGKLMELTHEFIPPEERSFTIISFPTPEIGEQFDELFADVVRINTLDNAKYREIQQHLIDALDTGVCVHVKGAGENRTDLTVALAKLHDPERETIFENCTADVNIPVGEVFTSPRLEGTEGVLHVSSVYLEGLLYRNLELKFTDGKIVDYSCGNGSSEEEIREGQQYIRENLLQNHPTLPMGEFAIGTNTLAYRTGRKYEIQDRMPILIAEKTGPHFAVGDTCYSYEEDHAVYNPDGKEIIARENSCSALREEHPEQAYFQVHTDITIPYDELDRIEVIRRDGTAIDLIRNGKFVLPGTEELNEFLD